MLKLSHICKTFDSPTGPVRAVDDVSLSVATGQIYGVIGFSGAGKSTLVRCINLLERPDSGQVQVDGRELTGLSPRELYATRRRIGMIFQHFNLMPSRTVSGNIALALRHSGLSAAERERKIDSLLELVDLSDKKSSFPAQLSGGQQQRVAIARALANDPKLLLCDEATSALDPQTTHSILRLLRKVNERLGLTIVVITHQMSVIKEICDRVAVMQNGRIIEEGPIIEIFGHPREELTRNFINSANNVNKFLEMVAAGHFREGLKPGERVLLLTYSGASAGDPLMACLLERFGVRANIIFGNIDYLRGVALGKLGVILSGAPDQIEAAEAYLRERGVTVEEAR